MSSNVRYTKHSYGTDHELQNLGVWQWTRPIPERSTNDNYAYDGKYWFIYIHGGIWRDPRITHLQAKPLVDLLARTPANAARIAGFASIDYRLSPHPDFPQDAATTPARELRNATHPDHLTDVRSALAFLRREYGIGEREGETPFVLYGHSCGATLAFQVIMDFECGPGRAEVPVPSAVVGFQGMYDLVGLNRRFNGAYREMIAGAFGDDEEVWKRVSPAHFKGSYHESWSEAHRGVMMLAYSAEDEWIDVAEIDAMEKRAKTGEPAPIHVRVRKDLKGGHDAVAEDGRAVAQVLVETVSHLLELYRMMKIAEETFDEMYSGVD